MIEYIKGFQVIRDDQTYGGTKRHALEHWLPQLRQNRFIYAGSVFGWGAPALSEACASLGLKCTILLGQSPYSPSWLARLGATPTTRLVITAPMPVEHICKLAIEQYPDWHLLPLGFSDPGFSEAITQRAKKIPPPLRAWVPVVSGTLLSALELAWPDTEFHGVCAAKNHSYTGKAVLHRAPEKFTQPARLTPPYPSCPFSDAKIWQFVSTEGKEGDLIWNTNP